MSHSTLFSSSFLQSTKTWPSYTYKKCTQNYTSLIQVFLFFLQIDAPEAKFISHHLDILCSDTDVPDKARPCANSEPTTGHYSGGTTERMHTKTTIKVMPATRCTLWEHSTSSPRIAVIVHQTKMCATISISSHSIRNTSVRMLSCETRSMRI